jgi:ATP:corrinoid adenosyltransferase
MEGMMVRSQTHVLSIAVLTFLGASASLAQGQTQPQSAPKPTDMSTMKMEDVSKWTQKQWNAAKTKWSEEKTKWNDCQTQAKTKDLSGRKSWQFLYDCMTK